MRSRLLFFQAWTDLKTGYLRTSQLQVTHPTLTIGGNPGARGSSHGTKSSQGSDRESLNHTAGHETD